MSANLNSCNISEMDEATLFKFGKWVKWQGSPQCEKFPLKGVWSGSRDPFKILNLLQYFWNG